MEILKVWATVDHKGMYPYIDIFDNKEEAESYVGKQYKNSALTIVDVYQGWCIINIDPEYEHEMEDIYLTYERALEDFNNFKSRSNKQKI